MHVVAHFRLFCLESLVWTEQCNSNEQTPSVTVSKQSRLNLKYVGGKRKRSTCYKTTMSFSVHMFCSNKVCVLSSSRTDWWRLTFQSQIMCSCCHNIPRRPWDHKYGDARWESEEEGEEDQDHTLGAHSWWQGVSGRGWVSQPQGRWGTWLLSVSLLPDQILFSTCLQGQGSHVGVDVVKRWCSKIKNIQ